VGNNKNPNEKQPGEKEPGTFHYNPGNMSGKPSSATKAQNNSKPTPTRNNQNKTVKGEAQTVRDGNGIEAVTFLRDSRSRRHPGIRRQARNHGDQPVFNAAARRRAQISLSNCPRWNPVMGT
jgi:hypothetical protein